MIEFKELEKSYTSGFSFGPFSSTVNKDSTVAVLGRNGAGKSTLFNILTGCMDATNGSIHVENSRVSPVNTDLKKKFGYLPQNTHLPQWLSAVDILEYAQTFYQAESYDLGDILQYWDCTTYKNKPMASLSHGMQKRVGLASATFHNPEILILDEPFSGLDIFHIKALKDLIKNRSKNNTTTFVCTHIAPYAAELCDQAWFIKDGHAESIKNWTELSFDEKIQSFERALFDHS